MLSVSSVAIGTIVDSHGWSGTGDVSGNFVGSEAEANASGIQEEEYSHAYGWWQLATTEEGWFDWSYYIDASAWADIYYEDENTAWAWGDGEAEVDLSDFTSPASLEVPAYAYVEDGDCGDPPYYFYRWNYPNSISTSYYSWFEENEKIECDHEVSAHAFIMEGSDSSTYGWSEGVASISLSEH
jgi:hypothetical protein